MTAVGDISVLLVEDHDVVREGIRMLLERDGRIAVVGEAGTMDVAIKEAARLKPKIIVADVRLPDGSGLELCDKVPLVSPDSRIIFLTAFPDDKAVLAAVKGGARGYLLKEVKPDGLLKCILEVAEGQSVIDPAVMQPLLNKLQTMMSEKSKKDDHTLPVQQEKVLSLMAEGKTNKEIAVQLGLSEKTIKNYVRIIFQRLHITRRSQAAVYYVTKRNS